MAGRNGKRNGVVIARSRLDAWIVARVVDRDESALVWVLQRTVFALCSFVSSRAGALGFIGKNMLDILWGVARVLR